MKWKIAKAKQHLSALVRRAAREPQVICNRDAPVAVVIAPEEFQAFEDWRAQQASRPLAAALEEAQRICAEEDYALELPERRDRANAMMEGTKRASRRHQRPE